MVLGNGEVARRKAEPLAAAGATVLLRDRFDPDDLDGCTLAIGADAPEPELRALAATAAARGIPVNVVDRPELGSFISPALIDRDPLTVAISTGGAAPVLARLLRQRIEALLPPALGRLAALGERFRDELRRRLPDPQRRRPLLEAAFTGPALDLLAAGRDPEAAAAFEQALQGEPRAGAVFDLVAPPAPDLLTVRDHRLMGQADVVVHDSDVADDILAMGRRDGGAPGRRPCHGRYRGPACGRRSPGDPLGYCATHPPSIETGAPVMVAAASEHRNTANAPICSGVEKRANGCFSARKSRVTSATALPSRLARASSWACTRGVRTHPGQMALTVIPLSANSIAMTLVSPTNPCFAAT